MQPNLQFVIHWSAAETSGQWNITTNLAACHAAGNLPLTWWDES